LGSCRTVSGADGVTAPLVGGIIVSVDGLLDIMTQSIYYCVMLYPTPKISADDARVLAEIDAMRQELRRAIRGTPAKWTDGLRKFLTADAIAASNSIEGFKVSTVDVADLIEGEHDVDISEENLAETVAYQHMMTYIQTLHDAPDFTFSKGFLNALHWMLQGHRHSPRKPAGQWRHGPVYVTDARDASIAAYTAPPAADVPGLTAELIDWLNAADGTAPLVQAAMAHLHLVSIHPWADGNGRLSRSLQTLLIAREGILAPEFSSVEGWLGRQGNTWEYYRELASRGPTYQPAQDVSSWVRFNLVAYHQQAQVVLHRVARSGRTCRLLMDYAQQAGLDERVVSALHDVAMTGRARRLRYEHAEGLSLQQAQRDLRDLVSADILESVGRTRARYYREGPRFPETALTEARTPMTIANPYPG
jgi:Fic family protein